MYNNNNSNNNNNNKLVDTYMRHKLFMQLEITGSKPILMPFGIFLCG